MSQHKLTTVEKSQAKKIIKKILGLFSSVTDIDATRMTAEFGNTESLWEMRLKIRSFRRIPYFIISQPENSSMLRIYLKAAFKDQSFPLKSPLRYMLNIEASRSSLFFTPLAKDKETPETITGFALAAMLPIEGLTSRDIIDACSRINFTFNTLTTTIELSAMQSQMIESQANKETNDNENNLSFYT